MVKTRKDLGYFVQCYTWSGMRNGQHSANLDDPAGKFQNIKYTMYSIAMETVLFDAECTSSSHVHVTMPIRVAS